MAHDTKNTDKPALTINVDEDTQDANWLAQVRRHAAKPFQPLLRRLQRITPIPPKKENQSHGR